MMRFLLLIFTILIFGPSAYAQTPQSELEFLVSWHSESLVPDTYRGKILPIYNSSISVYVELLRDGTLVDLSDQQVRWLINGKFFQNERNLKRITYRTQTRGNSEDVVRIQIPGYQQDVLEHIVTIPIVRPEIAVSATYPYRQIPSGEVSLRAIPYFFIAGSLNDLLFEWKINNERPIGAPANPNMITLRNSANAPDGAPISVFVSAQNKNRETEIGTKTIKFSLKK